MRGSNIGSLEPLRFLDNLEWLNIAETDISSIHEIKELKFLTYLDISDANSLLDFEPIRYLANLKELNASNTMIDDVSVLSGLPRLEVLVLRKTPVRDISPLGKLSTLRWLALGSTLAEVDEDFRENLLPLSQLQWLELPDGGTKGSNEWSRAAQREVTLFLQQGH